MSEESQSGCELRRRRSAAASPSLQLDVGAQVSESGPSHGTPSPCSVRYETDADSKESRASALREFRKKQQSFDNFDIQIDECEEVEIIVDSDEEGEPEHLHLQQQEQPRALTPTPIQDFGANVTYTEAPQLDFLQVKTIEHDCVTDVSDAESEEES